MGRCRTGRGCRLRHWSHVGRRRTAERLATPARRCGSSRIPIPNRSSENPVAALPTTVRSFDGVAVTITDTSRIVAADQIRNLRRATVYALGLGDSAGRAGTSSAKFPAVEDVPVVTPGGRRSPPRPILELNPTVVLTDTSIGPQGRAGPTAGRRAFRSSTSIPPARSKVSRHKSRQSPTRSVYRNRARPWSTGPKAKSPRPATWSPMTTIPLKIAFLYLPRLRDHHDRRRRARVPTR